MSFTPEWKLLLACAKTHLSTEDCQRLITELNNPELDCDQLTRLACAHGLAPLVFHSLQRCSAVSRLPPTAARALEISYYGNAAKNALLFEELGSVLTALGGKNIEVIVLKGGALAETVYPNRALRPMSDVDLLIRKERLAEAETTLLDLGYLFKWDLGTKQWLEKNFYNVTFDKPPIKIEIHWHIGPQSRLGLSLDEFWAGARPCKIAGVETTVLSPEHLLFELCQHFWKHQLIGGLRPLCDISETARFYGNEIDWGKVVALSAEWGIAPYSYVELWLAKRLLGAPIPDNCLDQLRPANFDPAVLDWARDRIVDYRSNSPVSPDFLQLIRAESSYQERWAALRKAFSLTGSTSNKTYLLYPRRIGRLVGHYGPIAWQLLSGDPKMRAAARAEQTQLRLTKWLSSGPFQEKRN